MTLSEVSH